MKSRIAIALLGLSLFAAASCNTRPSPGIEAGNPDIDVKSIRVVTSAAVYDISFVDESTAVVARTSSGADAESVAVPYRREGMALNLEAGFEDGEDAEVSTIVDGGGNIVSGVLKINGEPVTACFEVPGLSPKCPESGTGPEDSVDSPALVAPTEGTWGEDAPMTYEVGEHSVKPSETPTDSVKGAAENFDQPQLSGLGGGEPEPASLPFLAPTKTAPAIPHRPLQLAR
ncbi:MAG TPA: hypothetical protein VLJ37_06560 [bacterium]|nr:hypothetical protein [bacterium]